MARAALAVLLATPLFGCGVEIEREPLSLTVLYPVGGLGDRGFADSVSYAVLFGRWQFRLNLLEIEPADAEEASFALDEVLSSSPPDTLVVTVGFDYQTPLAARGCALGEATLVHLDTSLPTCDALRSVTYRTFSPSFEAGVAAIEKIRLLNAERDTTGRPTLPLRVAAFGGTDIPPVREFLAGFAAGVAHAGGELAPVEYLADDTSGFDDVEGARALASRLFDQVSVVFPVAGGASLGALEVAENRRAETGEPHFVVAVDADLSPVGPDVVLGSVLKRVDRTIREAMFTFARGDFEPGDVVVGTNDGSTELLLNLLHDQSAILPDPLPLTTAVNAARDAALTAEMDYFNRSP